MSLLVASAHLTGCGASSHDANPSDAGTAMSGAGGTGAAGNAGSLGTGGGSSGASGATGGTNGVSGAGGVSGSSGAGGISGAAGSPNCLASAGAGGSTTASTASQAYSAWNAAFLEQNNGKPYYTVGETKVSNEIARMYTGALDLAIAEDAYQQTHSQSQRKLIAALVDTYLLDNVATSSGNQGENGINWAYDGWNDDIGWMVNAVLRAYQYTGTPRYLQIAEDNSNMGYKRGWSSDLGGGIWENDQKAAGKEALSNNPFVWEGVVFYQLTGDGSYLDKAKAIYAWVRTNLVNTTNAKNNLGEPGQVNQGIKGDGSLSGGDNVYNEGAFVTAATALCRVTGDQQYYDDAQRTIAHVMAKEPILRNGQEACGCQWAYWFTFGLSQFANVSGLWSQYLPYLQKNADAAWSQRNDLDLTWNDWTTKTPNAVAAKDPDAVEMHSAVAIWQHLPPPSLDLSCSYEVQNVASGLALTVQDGSKAEGAAIVQVPFTSGAANAVWTFVPTSGGYYRIKNANSGLVLNVSGKSALSAAKVVQNTAQGLIPGSDQWLPVLNGDGSYSFYNLNSLQALDNPGASETAVGTPIDQAFGNSSSAQSFKLIAR